VLATQNDDGCRGACFCDASGCSCEGACIANADNRPCEDDVQCRAAAGGVDLSPSATCDTGTDCGAEQIACVETVPDSFQCVPASQALSCANNESRFDVPLVDDGQAISTRITICVPRPRRAVRVRRRRRHLELPAPAPLTRRYRLSSSPEAPASQLARRTDLDDHVPSTGALGS
jgi:hypothetical protein